MDKLFDIAHSNALELMKIEVDKAFLISQQNPGRPGCMLGVDMNQTNTEKRKNLRIETEITKKKKYNSQISKYATGNY